MSMRMVQEATPQSGVAVAATSGPAAVTMFTTDEALLRSVALLLRGERYRLTGRRQPQSLAGLLSDRRMDVVLVDLRWPTGGPFDLGPWSRVRREPTIPILGICGSETPRAARLAALAEGLWDVVELPLEAAELDAKLETWIWLKRSIDGLRSAVLLDVESGHYSSQGMRRRLRELSALAQRTGDSLSCILFGADPLPPGMELTSTAVMNSSRVFSLALHHQTRNSDVVGRLEPLKFMVLAPNTPPVGAVQLAGRVTSLLLSRRVDGRIPTTFSAGVAGVDSHNGQVQAIPELLFAASSRALNEARASGTAQVSVAWRGNTSEGGGEWIAE